MEFQKITVPFFSWNGQDFYAFTIFDPTNFYRATGLCYIHYTSDGHMKADQMIAEFGVGQYNSDWNKIQAEWYMRGANIRKMENIWGGFDVGEISSKSELYYPNISGLSNKKRIHFLVSSVIDESKIEVLDQKTGNMLGSCQIRSTGGHTHEGYRIFSCDLALEEKQDASFRMDFGGFPCSKWHETIQLRKRNHYRT